MMGPMAQIPKVLTTWNVKASRASRRLPVGGQWRVANHAWPMRT